MIIRFETPRALRGCEGRVRVPAPWWNLQSAEWDFRLNWEILGVSSFIFSSGWLLPRVWPSESQGLSDELTFSPTWGISLSLFLIHLALISFHHPSAPLEIPAGSWPGTPASSHPPCLVPNSGGLSYNADDLCGLLHPRIVFPFLPFLHPHEYGETEFYNSFN